MKIVWIIDNKFRELYGLYDLKKRLLEHKIELFLFNIPVWKTAIDLINPHIVVVPNLAKRSCEPVVKYASKKKNKGIYAFLGRNVLYGRSSNRKISKSFNKKN